MDEKVFQDIIEYVKLQKNPEYIQYILYFKAYSAPKKYYKILLDIMESKKKLESIPQQLKGVSFYLI